MIEKSDVEGLARLARIELSEQEVERLQKEFGDILSYISELSVVASATPDPSVGSIFNVMRDDLHPHETGKFTKELLREAPACDNNYIQVKKIL